MTGGSLNLASASGAGDDIININPQITFFKKVYKRHTNFGLETREVSESTNNSVDFGESVTYNITKTGTLISDMYFEFTLPPANKTAGKNKNGKEFSANNDGVVSNWEDYCTWVNAVGFAILNEVKLEIDGNTIDRQNGLWFDIWNELTDPNRKEWSLVGKRDDTNLKRVTNRKSRYYIPLKFYFNRNPGLAFPIFLVDDNKVKVTIKLNSLNSLLVFKQKDGETATIDDNASITKFKFFTTYIFLDTSEQNRIRNNLPNEYLIETTTINSNLSSSGLSKIILNNPVKELLWVIRKRSRISTGSASGGIILNNVSTINDQPNDLFNYSLDGENTGLAYGSFDTFKTLKISISNKDRIDTTDATFFRTIQPYKHHSNTPGGINGNEKKKYIYTYSFALNPEEYQPSGSYNFSKGDDDLKLEFTGLGSADASTNDLTNYRIDLFAFHYKFLSVFDGRIQFKDVPYSSSVQATTETTIADKPELQQVETEVKKAIVKQKCKQRTDEAIAEEEKRLIAIEKEIRRRYAAKRPDVHRHLNFEKSKWSGLEGDFKNKK